MNLIEKVNSRKAKIGIIGLGYVGLPYDPQRSVGDALKKTENGMEVRG